MNEREANDLVEGAEFGDRSGYVAEGYIARVDQEKGIFGPLVGAINEFRDTILHERGALAELTETNSDFINAVLVEFDATIGEALEAFYKENPSWPR